MSGMVLVVDDDEGVRAVMATALEDDGWRWKPPKTAAPLSKR